MPRSSKKFRNTGPVITLRKTPMLRSSKKSRNIGSVIKPLPAAKKRALKAMLNNCITRASAWMGPNSKWESATVALVEALPVVKVSKASEEAMSVMGMIVGRCHDNARRWADDSNGALEPVHGWVIDDSPDEPRTYVLHSVVKEKATGIHCCVTPTSRAYAGYRDDFDFIPDAGIARGQWDMKRDGHALSVGLRKDPDVLRQNALKRIALWRAAKRKL
jgi:hypothetical protein